MPGGVLGERVLQHLLTPHHEQHLVEGLDAHRLGRSGADEDDAVAEAARRSLRGVIPHAPRTPHPGSAELVGRPVEPRQVMEVDVLVGEAIMS